MNKNTITISMSKSSYSQQSSTMKMWPSFWTIIMNLFSPEKWIQPPHPWHPWSAVRGSSQVFLQVPEELRHVSWPRGCPKKTMALSLSSNVGILLFFKTCVVQKESKKAIVMEHETLHKCVYWIITTLRNYITDTHTHWVTKGYKYLMTSFTLNPMLQPIKNAVKPPASFVPWRPLSRPGKGGWLASQIQLVVPS